MNSSVDINVAETDCDDKLEYSICKEGIYTTYKYIVKSNMNKYKLYKTSAIFFQSNIFLIQVLTWCMSWLISIARTYSSFEKRKREWQNETFLPRVGFEAPTFRLRSDRANHYAMKSDSIDKIRPLFICATLTYITW